MRLGRGQVEREAERERLRHQLVHALGQRARPLEPAQLGERLLLEHVTGDDRQRLGDRRVGLAEVAHELAVLLPDPAVRLLVLLQHRADDPRQHAPAFLEEQVRQPERLAAEVLVDAAHHVGQRVVLVALQQIVLHALVRRAALPGLLRARKIVAAETARQAPATDLGIGEVVDLAREALRLGLGRADHRAETRQDQHMLGAAPLGRRQPFQIGVEFLRGCLRHMGGEHRLGVARGKAAAGVGGTRLYQHRSALRAARHVERPGDLVEVASVVDRADPLAPGIDPAGPIIEHRVGGPAVP